MANGNRAEANQAAQLAAHWRARAHEYQRLARGPERSMFKRAAEQATAIAARFERATRYSSDFAIAADGEAVACRDRQQVGRA
jgi:hypothetical protein